MNMKKKILTLLVLLMTAVTGAWAGTQATGYFDHCTAHHGSIFVDGWAYDPDQSSVSIQVHAYIWYGTSASGSHMPVVVIDTDVERSDVNSAKGITGIHGFERYITVPAGTYTVEIYAIDINGDGNPKLPVAVPGDPTYITVTVTGDPYNITYDANGGSDAPDAQQKGENVQLTLSSTVPTRTGYTFAGWNTASDGSGTAYAAGATYTANAALTLYAQWTQNTAPAYDVTANLANGAYWATFYSNAGNYQAPDGTQVFAVNLNTTTAEITMSEISDRIVKSGEGVVLKQETTSSDAATTITMTLTATAATDSYFSGNSLTGTMTDITNPDYGHIYVLNGTNGAGFYKLSSSGTIGANKAYLTYAGALAREFFLFDEATGIESIDHSPLTIDHSVYDLQGRRVAQPTKGLYIVNGKKVVIK